MKKILALTLAAAVLTLSACGIHTLSESTPLGTLPTQETTQTTIATTPAQTESTTPTETTDTTTAETTTAETTTEQAPVILPGYSVGLSFISNGDGTCTLSGKGECQNEFILVPPVSPKGDAVTAVDAFAFRGDEAMHSIILPEGIAKIGEGAFADCPVLTEVKIASGLTVLEKDVFAHCVRLTGVSLPDTLRAIEERAFYDCRALAALYLPVGITEIGDSAFENCGLQYLNLPSALNEIGKRAFKSCSSLVRVEFHEGLYAIEDEAFFGCLFPDGISLPTTLRVVGENVFNFSNLSICAEYGNAYYLPSRTNPHFLLLRSATTLIDTFTLHPDTSVIAAGAFRGCMLPQTLILPNTVVAIGDRAFAHCSGIRTLSFGNNIEVIGAQAFSQCPIEELVVPHNVRLVGERAFEYSGAHRLSLQGGETLHELAFAFSTNLKSVTISTQTKALPARLFYGARLLNEIRYAGTTAEWEALPKAENWNEKMGGTNPDGTKCDFCLVICADGNIRIPYNHD
jgi:hypothetical protein